MGLLGGRVDPVRPMANALIRVTVHVVWTTWERTPWIDVPTERIVRDAIFAQFERVGCVVHACGAAEDHVHGLGDLNATTTLAEWVRAMKGASTHATARHRGGPFTFRWQEGYGPFGVSEHDLEQVAAYVRTQREHHVAKTIDASREP